MTTADELASRIFELPTLPYFFEGGDGLRRYAYLGGDEAGKSEKLRLNYVHKAAFLRLSALYSDGAPPEEALDAMLSEFKKLTGGSRLAGVYTADEQKNYLGGLSCEELSEISREAKMYSFCLGIKKRRPAKGGE